MPVNAPLWWGLPTPGEAGEGRGPNSKIPSKVNGVQRCMQESDQSDHFSGGRMAGVGAVWMAVAVCCFSAPVVATSAPDSLTSFEMYVLFLVAERERVVTGGAHVWRAAIFTLTRGMQCDRARTTSTCVQSETPCSA
jgi:hypothetical protein